MKTKSRDIEVIVVYFLIDNPPLRPTHQLHSLSFHSRCQNIRTSDVAWFVK